MYIETNASQPIKLVIGNSSIVTKTWYLSLEEAEDLVTKLLERIKEVKDGRS